MTMPTIPDSGSATSKLALAKFGLSTIFVLGGVAAAIWAPPVIAIWLAGTLIGIGAQGGISGMIGLKAADASGIPKPQ